MAEMTLAELSETMGDIDFAMLFTKSEAGDIAGRPMSNNGDVEYDGSSYFFTWDESHTVRDIKSHAKVGLSFQGNKGLLGKPPIFIAVEGEASLIEDKKAFEDHWVPDLERWFKNGVDTPGLVLIKVKATRIHFWRGEDDGEIKL